MTDQTVVRTVEHVDPSPLPENNWFWRRVYVFVVTALLCGHVGWLSLQTDDVVTLRMIVRNDQGLILLYALLYLAGASTEAIANIIASVRTTRRETITSAAPPSSITTPDVTVSTPPAAGRASAPAPPVFGVPDKPSWTP
jgi:uncharacterized membrane protein YfcA